MSTSFDIPMMVIPGVGGVSRLCHGTTKDGKKCRVTGPWDWTPAQGDWYCRVHQHQRADRG